MLNYYAFLVREWFVPAKDHISHFVEALWQLVCAVLLALCPRNWLVFTNITVAYANTLITLTPLTGRIDYMDFLDIHNLRKQVV